MPSTPFAPISKHHERVLFQIVEAREGGFINSDSFQVLLEAPGLVIDRLPIFGSVQDLLVLEEAGYLSVRHEDPADGRRTWFASLKEQGRAYYKWRHSAVPQRLLASLRPSSDDVRRVLYSGAVAAALLKGLDAIGPWLQAAIETLRHRP